MLVWWIEPTHTPVRLWFVHSKQLTISGVHIECPCPCIARCTTPVSTLSTALGFMSVTALMQMLLENGQSQCNCHTFSCGVKQQNSCAQLY
eukprot:6036153-Amphidinium_carterae.1